MATSQVYATRQMTFADFDPNKQFSDNPLYGLFDGYRFRTFAARGHMLNAFHSSPRAKCYEQTPTGWKLIATKNADSRPDVCDECGNPAKSTYSWGFSKAFVFRRDERGKIADPLELLFLCSTCRKLHA